MHHADFSYQVCVSAAAAGRPEGADRLQLHPKRVGFTTGPGPVLGQPEDPQAENMTTAHGLARPWAPIFLLTGAICRLAKPLLRNVERVEHVGKPRGKPDRGIHRRQADEDRGVETY